MKFTTACQQSEPVAEFGVRISAGNNPILYVNYKGETIDLLYLDSSDGCRLCRYHIASRHLPLMQKIGINVTNNSVMLVTS